MDTMHKYLFIGGTADCELIFVPIATGIGGEIEPKVKEWALVFSDSRTFKKERYRAMRLECKYGCRWVFVHDELSRLDAYDRLISGYAELRDI